MMMSNPTSCSYHTDALVYSIYILFVSFVIVLCTSTAATVVLYLDGQPNGSDI